MFTRFKRSGKYSVPAVAVVKKKKKGGRPKKVQVMAKVANPSKAPATTEK